MIEAGVAALAGCPEPDLDSASDIVVAVYVAMDRPEKPAMLALETRPT